MSAWAEERLKVPPGHPLSGEPMKLPDYGVAFISDALSHRESLLWLLRQMAEIAVASDLPGLEFRKSPLPGHIRTPDGSTAEFLSADKSSGHSSGFDIVIVDELGLMGERDRDLVAGMRTATSARDGRFVSI